MPELDPKTAVTGHLDNTDDPSTPSPIVQTELALTFKKKQQVLVYCTHHSEGETSETLDIRLVAQGNTYEERLDASGLLFSGPSHGESLAQTLKNMLF